MEHNRLTVSVEEAAALLGISRALAYELVRRGDLPGLRLGRRVVVPRKGLEQLVEAPSRPGRDDSAGRSATEGATAGVYSGTVRTNPRTSALPTPLSPLVTAGRPDREAEAFEGGTAPSSASQSCERSATALALARCVAWRSILPRRRHRRRRGRLALGVLARTRTAACELGYSWSRNAEGETGMPPRPRSQFRARARRMPESRPRARPRRRRLPGIDRGTPSRPGRRSDVP